IYVHITVFFVADPATPDVYTLSLHDALPILGETVEGAALEEAVASGVLAALGTVGVQGTAGCALSGLFALGLVSPCAEACSRMRSEEHTSELQSRFDLVCRLLLEKKKRQ